MRVDYCCSWWGGLRGRDYGDGTTVAGVGWTYWLGERQETSTVRWGGAESRILSREQREPDLKLCIKLRNCTILSTEHVVAID